MPISLSAKKSLRKSLKQRKVNRAAIGVVKAEIKKFFGKPSQERMQKVVSMVDKAVKTNRMHRNKAARLKSRMAREIESKKPAAKKDKVA